MENINNHYPLLLSLIVDKQLRIKCNDSNYICSFDEITSFQDRGCFRVKNCLNLTNNKYYDRVTIFSLFFKKKQFSDIFSESIINIFSNNITIDSIYDKTYTFYKKEWGDKYTMTIEILGNLHKLKP